MTAAKIGVDLDLFNILEMNRRLTTIDLAQATGIEPDLLLRLLKFIASFGLIEELNTNLWTSSWATTTLARPSVAAGINHKYVASINILLGSSLHGRCMC